MSFFNHPTYHDKWFILLFVPFANTINYFLTYTFPKPLDRFLLTYSIDTIQGFLSVLIIRSIIIYLDKKIGYFQNIAYRLVIQIFSTSFFGLLFTSVTTEIICYWDKGTFLPWSFYTLAIPIIFIWILVVNGVYTGLYFYHHLIGYQEKIKQLEQVQIITPSHKEKAETENTNSSQNSHFQEQNHLIVGIGKQQVVLDWKDIACFYVEDELTLTLTYSNKKYILNHSLEKLEEFIPKQLFFRANRQVIIHKEAVQKVIKEENGKLLLIPREIKDIPNAIGISRTKAPAFKKWLGMS
jgi:DNA-binding LytR/AlgR family response regulator